MKKRVFAWIMTLCMIVSMMPMAAHATETTCTHEDYYAYCDLDSGNAASGHNLVCMECEETIGFEAHSMSAWEAYPGGWERGCTAGCDYSEDTTTDPTHTHSYSAATCTTPATCTCGATQGGVDKSNHVGGTEIRNAVAAGEFTEGYTGDTYCLGCGDQIASGETIPATHTHSFSIWDYDDTMHWQKCECGEGSTAAQAHQFDDDADTSCKCGYTRVVHTHSYSTATCTTPATCTCGATQGGVDKSNHVGGTEIRNTVAAGEFTEGYTGDTHCKGCGDKLSSGETIPATHTHSYSTATCTTPATCTCGATQGGVDKSNHVGGTEIRNTVAAGEFTEGYTGDTHCKGCGDKLSSGETIPATHKCSFSSYAYDRNGHWQVCTCGATTAAEDHDWYIYKKDASQHYWRCDCGNNGWGNEHFDNNDTGKCDDCGYVMPHTHEWSDWTSNNDGTHSRTCSANDDTQTADCSDSDDANELCDTCGYNMHPHNYTVLYNDDVHWEGCSCGAKQNQAEHVYSNDTDLTCDTCGYTRSVEGSLSITGSMPDATVGEAYSASFSYSGEASGVIFWSATGLPDGLSMDAGTGVVSGTPTTAGTYNVTIAMGATGGGSASRSFTLTVENTPAHRHSYRVLYNETHHWEECRCDRTRNKEEHFDDDGDELCDSCGHDLHEHIYDVVKYNNTYHWTVCICGDFEIRYFHQYENDSDATCDCGYTRLLNHEHEWSEWVGATRSHVVSYMTDNKGENKFYYIYLDGEPAGVCNFSTIIKGKNNTTLTFFAGKDPESVKGENKYPAFSFNPPADSTIGGVDFEAGKVYNATAIAATDISVINALFGSDAAEKAARAKVEELKKKMDEAWHAYNTAGYEISKEESAALHDDYTNARSAYMEALKELEKYQVKQEVAVPAEYVGNENVSYIAVHYGKLGAEIGEVAVSEDGKTLNITYAVSDFSPFVIYAITEREEVEIQKTVLEGITIDESTLTHVVQRGENLTDIARMYGCTVDEIVSLNADLIENPSLIFAGWELRVPVK